MIKDWSIFGMELMLCFVTFIYRSIVGEILIYNTILLYFGYYGHFIFCVRCRIEFSSHSFSYVKVVGLANVNGKNLVIF